MKTLILGLALISGACAKSNYRVCVHNEDDTDQLCTDNVLSEHDAMLLAKYFHSFTGNTVVVSQQKKGAKGSKSPESSAPPAPSKEVRRKDLVIL